MTGRRPCTVEGCDLPRHSRSLCRLHYNRANDGRPLHHPLETRVDVIRDHIAVGHTPQQVADDLGIQVESLYRWLTNNDLHGERATLERAAAADPAPKPARPRVVEPDRPPRPSFDPRAGRCTTYPAELWHDPEATAYARAVCHRCPIQTACLTAALWEERDSPAQHIFGIRGGLGPTERARMRVDLETPPTAEAVA